MLSINRATCRTYLVEYPEGYTAEQQTTEQFLTLGMNISNDLALVSDVEPNESFTVFTNCR